MSPELFKCFVHQLFEELNCLDGMEAPVLNSVQITDLLYAVYLILMALKPLSLQKIQNTIDQYCLEWGHTSLNIAKTAVRVFKFNRTGRLLNESKFFHHGKKFITSPLGRSLIQLVCEINLLSVAQDSSEQAHLSFWQWTTVQWTTVQDATSLGF